MQEGGTVQVVLMSDWRYDYNVDNDTEEDQKLYQIWGRQGLSELKQSNQSSIRTIVLYCVVIIAASVVCVWWSLL